MKEKLEEIKKIITKARISDEEKLALAMSVSAAKKLSKSDFNEVLQRIKDYITDEEKKLN